MKIRPEDFNELEAAINLYIYNADGKAVRNFLNFGHSDTRMRWDFLWAVPQEVRTPIVDRIYTYGNDTHINTALKHITGI